MRKLTVLIVSACLVLAMAVRAEDGKEIRAIVDKAIKAHGGEKNLLKIKTSQSIAKGTLEAAGNTIPFTANGSVQLPDKIKVEMSMEANNMTFSIVTVVNGNKGWGGLAGSVKELEEDKLKQAKEDLHASEINGLTCLKEDRFKLSLLGESKVDDKQAVGLRVSSKGYRDVNLYFDKDNGLLVKTESRSLDPVTGQEVTQEKFYSNFKDVDGVKTPGHVVVKNDGKTFLEMDVSVIRFPASLEDSVFTKP